MIFKNRYFGIFRYGSCGMLLSALCILNDCYLNLAFAAGPPLLLPQYVLPVATQGDEPTLNYEMHSLTNWPSSVANPTASNTNCAPGGVYVYNSMTQVSATGGSSQWMYGCNVIMTPYDKLNNTRWTQEQSSSSNNGWNSVPVIGCSSSACTSIGVTDLATFQYPNGMPQTTFTSDSCMNYTNGYYSFLSIYLTIGSSPQAQSGRAGSNTCSEVATLTMLALPGARYSFTKQANGGYYNGYCYSTFVMPASWVGQTISLGCYNPGDWNNGASYGPTGTCVGSGDYVSPGNGCVPN